MKTKTIRIFAFILLVMSLTSVFFNLSHSSETCDSPQQGWLNRGKEYVVTVEKDYQVVGEVFLGQSEEGGVIFVQLNPRVHFPKGSLLNFAILDNNYQFYFDNCGDFWENLEPSKPSPEEKEYNFQT